MPTSKALVADRAFAGRGQVLNGMLVQWDVEIRMNDGNLLRGDVFRPAEGGRHPVILSHEAYASGKVGLLGISYYAINQWQVASRQPPHLVAICPWEGAADWYRDMTYHGGILCTFFPNWFDQQVRGVQHGVGARGPVSPVTGEPVAGPPTLSEPELAVNRADFGAAIRAHPFDDDYHRARSADFSRIRVPLLSAANWGGQGLHSRGNFEGYLRAASGEKWLEVHGLEHWTGFYTDYGVDLQKRFFGCCFLKGETEGWRDQPPVKLQVRTLDGFVQRGEREWPLARTRWTKLYLDHRGPSLSWRPVEREGAITYEAGGEGVTFIGPQLERQTEVTGPLAAKLFVSSSSEDADLFVVLRLFDSAGAEVAFQGAIDPRAPLAQGWLRASHRRLDPDLTTAERPYHAHGGSVPLVPGEVYELEIEVWPTSIIVPPGYRIGLTVRGSDYESAASGEAARLATFKNEMKGCGPFLHDDPRDRQRPRYEGTHVLHVGGLPTAPDRPRRG